MLLPCAEEIESGWTYVNGNVCVTFGETLAKLRRAFGKQLPLGYCNGDRVPPQMHVALSGLKGNLGPEWNQPGIACDHFGMTLASISNHAGITLEPSLLLFLISVAWSKRKAPIIRTMATVRNHTDTQRLFYGNRLPTQ